jgi:hypothetical protein
MVAAKNPFFRLIAATTAVTAATAASTAVPTPLGTPSPSGGTGGPMVDGIQLVIVL